MTDPLTTKWLLSTLVARRARQLIENGEPSNTTAAQFGLTPAELRAELRQLDKEEESK